MINLTRLSIALVRRWTWLYTLGAPAALKRQRRAELESDLWEHLAAASEVGEPPLHTALHLVARFAAGIPADLAWRLQARRFASESTLVMDEALVFGARRRALPRRSWLDRNLWVVPLVAVLALLAAMYSLMDSARPTRISFNVSAGDELSVSRASWQWSALFVGPDGYSYNGPEERPGFKTSHAFTVANHARHAAWVSLEGLPHNYAYRWNATGATGARAWSTRGQAGVEQREYLVLPPLSLAEVELEILGPPIKGFGQSEELNLRLVDAARVPD